MSEKSYPSVESRRSRSDNVCRLLSNRIREVTSPGLGRWDFAWELVRSPSALFLEALAMWETTGHEEAMKQAKELALEVLTAWKEAERQYRELDRVSSPAKVKARASRTRDVSTAAASNSDPKK